MYVFHNVPANKMQVINLLLLCVFMATSCMFLNVVCVFLFHKEMSLAVLCDV